MSIQLPKSGKMRNLASLSPLMQKGGKFITEQPKVKQRRARKQQKLVLKKTAWLSADND